MALELVNKDNVNPADAEFLYGDVRDKTPSIGGTKYNRATMSDYIQFFHRMMAIAQITYNNDLDNEANGWQFFEALQSVLPKKYVKQIVSDFDGEVVTITRAEIEAAFGTVIPFYNGAMESGTTVKPFVDLQVQVWYKLTGVWYQMPLTQTVGDGAIVTIDDATGDFTITLSLPPVSALDTRFVLMG